MHFSCLCSILSMDFKKLPNHYRLYSSQGWVPGVLKTWIAVVTKNRVCKLKNQYLQNNLQSIVLPRGGSNHGNTNLEANSVYITCSENIEKCFKLKSLSTVESSSLVYFNQFSFSGLMSIYLI